MTDLPVIDRVSADDVMSLAAGGTTPQVGAVLILGSGGPQPARLLAILGARLPAVPRLRQRLLPGAPWSGRPVWVDDPAFRVENHVTVLPCPAPGDRDALLDVAAQRLMTPLPLDRPLWGAVLVTGLPGDQSALIVILHHVLADGAAGLAVLAALLDGAPMVPSPVFPRPAPTRTQLRSDAARAALRAARALPAALLSVGQTLMQFAPALRTRVAPSSLNQPTGPRRRVATVGADLAQLHAAAHRSGATVNDLLLCAVAGALRRLLASRGELADHFIVSVPVSFRHDPSGLHLGNRSAVVPVDVPAAGAMPARLRAVARLTAQARRTRPGASNLLLGPLFRLLSGLGRYRHFIDHQRLIHTFVTNVRGPAEPLRLGGGPVLEVIPLATAGGNITVSFAALSYAGTFTVTALADPETCPELDALRGFLVDELAALTAPRPGSPAAPTRP